MRVITLDSNKTIISVKNVLDNYILQQNEIETNSGGIGQVQQSDGGFVAPTPPPLTLDEVKRNKINDINTAYQNVVYSTFTSTAFDGKTEETYSCSATDQSRINGEVTVAVAVKAGYSTETLSWKNVNEQQCVTWTADQIIKLGDDLHKFVTQKTDYLEALIVYINSLTTIDAVNAITWGMTIPTTNTTATS